MVNVLYVNGNIMKRGGIESFMMNYFRHIDKDKVHIDFIVHGYEKGVYDDEIIAAGSKIYHVPTKSKHPIQYQRELRKIFSSGEYKIVHSHLDAMSGWVLKIAAQCGVPVRIAHSHNTDHLTQNKVKRFVNEMAKRDIHKYATDRFACSEMAGKWLFDSDEFIVVKNAIEVEKFKFNESKRKELRKQFGVENDFVIGHVGRFDYQKNQEFLITVLVNLKKTKQNIKLVFVGDGDTRSDIESMAKRNGLYGDVIFLGSRQNVCDLYNTFDVFVLPSRFEGLGLVAVEAQANGLPCILSDRVPREVKILENVKFINIENTEQWINQLMNPVIYRSKEGANMVKEKGYDIICESKKIESYYICQEK